MMARKIKIIIAGAIAYWFAIFLYLRLFWHFPSEHKSGDFMFSTVIAPFILGLIISFLLKGKYDWIYCVITFHIYIIINSLKDFVVFVFIYKIYDVPKELSYIVRNYVHLKILASLFVIMGGLIGHYLNKRLPAMKRKKA